MTCSFCGKSIANKNALWTHVVFRHPEEAENIDLWGNTEKHTGSAEIKEEIKTEETLFCDKIENERKILSEKCENQELLSISSRKDEGNQNGRSRKSSHSSTTSSIILVDPVFENSGSDQSYFELPGYEIEETEKSVETSNLLAKLIKTEELNLECDINIQRAVKTSKLYDLLIRKEELEIEYENNIEDSVLDLAIDTAINDAIVDHIAQLEEYLQHIEQTFSILSLG